MNVTQLAHATLTLPVPIRLELTPVHAMTVGRNHSASY